MSSPTDEFSCLDYRELQQKCRDLKLPSGGSHEVLRKRLHDAANAVAATGSNKRQKKSPADDLICPITLDLPWEPMMAEDGRVYEKEAIEAHIKSRHPTALRSPITNEKMGSRLVPALQHKNLIETLIDNGGISGELALAWNKKKWDNKYMEAMLKKANDGDAGAMYTVGVNYFRGSKGCKKDYKIAFPWITKAHKKGLVIATAVMGQLLCYGLGCQTSHTQGMMYVGMAAGQGSDDAAFFLGKAMTRGAFGMEKDIPEAIRWLRTAVGGSCQYQHLSLKKQEQARGLLSLLTSSTNEPSTWI